MEAKAINRYIGSSPRKMRLVIDLIRGMRVDKALEILHFSSKHSSKDAEKTLRSAVANLLNSDDTTRVEPSGFICKRSVCRSGTYYKKNFTCTDGTCIQNQKKILSFNYCCCKKSIIKEIDIWDKKHTQ